MTTTAQLVKIAIDSGVNTSKALVGTHGHKMASQSNGMPAVWKFPDDSYLIIFGRGTSREVRVK